MNEEIQRQLIAALVERVMTLEAWREKVEEETNELAAVGKPDQ